MGVQGEGPVQLGGGVGVGKGVWLPVPHESLCSGVPGDTMQSGHSKIVFLLSGRQVTWNLPGDAFVSAGVFASYKAEAWRAGLAHGWGPSRRVQAALRGRAWASEGAPSADKPRWQATRRHCLPAPSYCPDSELGVGGALGQVTAGPSARTSASSGPRGPSGSGCPLRPPSPGAPPSQEPLSQACCGLETSCPFRCSLPPLLQVQERHPAAPAAGTPIHPFPLGMWPVGGPQRDMDAED